MSQGIKISQLAPATSITDNDSVPFSRGGIETFRIPAGIFVTAASNVGSGPGQIFFSKTNITPTTLQFRTLSASGESLSVSTIGNTVVISASGQNPIKRTLTGDGATTTWSLAPFNSVNAANYRIDIDGVLQEAFVDYNISNNNLVFTSAPLSASKIVVVSSNNVRLNEAVIAPNSITNEMFTDACVGTLELSAESVTTTKIAPSAVTESKIADNAVTFAKLANSSKILTANTLSATSAQFIDTSFTITQPGWLIVTGTGTSNYTGTTTNAGNYVYIYLNGTTSTNIIAQDGMFEGESSSINFLSNATGMSYLPPGTHTLRLEHTIVLGTRLSSRLSWVVFPI